MIPTIIMLVLGCARDPTPEEWEDRYAAAFCEWYDRCGSSGDCLDLAQTAFGSLRTDCPVDVELVEACEEEAPTATCGSEFSQECDLFLLYDCSQ